MRSEFLVQFNVKLVLGLFFRTDNFILARFEICTESAVRHGASHYTQFRRRVHKSLTQSKGRDSNYPENHTFFYPEFHGKEQYSVPDAEWQIELEPRQRESCEDVNSFPFGSCPT